MEKFFKLKERGTTVRTEITAGCTTFLAMAYILAVNPAILSQTGMNAASVFTATAIAAGIATLVMAFTANLPVALAPGMGLNAFFTFTVVLGMGYSWQTALTAVFLEGIFFIVLSIFKARQALIKAIPANLKKLYGSSLLSSFLSSILSLIKNLTGIHSGTLNIRNIIRFVDRKNTPAE